ncbi:MAG: hypothetical protein HOC09_35250 [Deltaproteobacteria bacterium]|nr:hypothetical protein [Deltaproteobacteria bacterium]
MELQPAIAKAFIKFQGLANNLGKDAKAYNYDYLTLGKIIEITRPQLAECGLAITQPMDAAEDGTPVLLTYLIHESGEYYVSRYPLSPVTMKQCNTAQQMGAAISYARRYALAAILNITQADDDAASVGQSTQHQGLSDAVKAEIQELTAVESLEAYYKQNIGKNNGAKQEFIAALAARKEELAATAGI